METVAAEVRCFLAVAAWALRGEGGGVAAALREGGVLLHARHGSGGFLGRWVGPLAAGWWWWCYM